MINPTDMHRWFKSDHLSNNLKTVVSIFQDALNQLDNVVDYPSAERSAGMRKLLEAKDCFVRAKILQDAAEPPLKS